MNSPIIQLLVLAGIAVFLILKLRSVLGTREGFEKPEVRSTDTESDRRRNDFEVIEGGPDEDIMDHAEDPSFHVGEFLGGARGAYEMILVAFENGDLASVLPFISEDVYEALSSVVDEREKKGLTVEANFIGISDMVLKSASFDEADKEAEITMRFKSEMTYQVRDAGGDVIEGNENEVKRQKDVWTFARDMGADDPNWHLVATGG